MPGEDDAKSSSLKKLEMVIKKGDTIVSLLEKQGIETDQIKRKMDDAKQSFSAGDLGKAYKLAQSSIVELMALKEKVEAERKDDRSGSKKGKGVFALIRDNNVETLKKIDEWKLIVKGWREKGYEIEKDDILFGKSFEEIERRFISIGEQIEKAEQLRGRMNALREEHQNIGKSYRRKVQDIEAAAFKLDRLEDLDRKLKTLSSSLKSVDERSANLRTRISRFKRNGLNTSYLEEILDNDEDMDYIEKQFNIYESNMEFLMKEKQKLKVFKDEPFIDGLEAKVAEIEAMLDNPWKLDDVVERMLGLERLLKVEKDNQRKLDDMRKRRMEIKKTLDKYSSEGYKVDMVEQLLDEDMNLLEEEFDIFMRQSSRLKSLKEKLFKLDATGFEDEVSKLSEKMFDPSNIDTIEKELEELKEKILNQRIRSQKIENAIKEWSGMGFKVTKLENALKRDMNGAERIYEDYRERIKELTDYDARLSEMQHKETADIVHKLSLMIKNPELIETVRKEMARVQKIVSDLDGIKNKRKELNTLLKVWKSQGYRIDHILELMKMENTYQGLEDIILGYTRAIASLESFRPEMAVESRGWFPETENFIKENMNDPDQSQEVLARFDELKGMNKKEERRRGEISRKLKELASRGIVVSKIEPLLLGDSATLTKEFESFKENVKNLLRLKADKLKDAHKTGDLDLEKRAREMNDPYLLDVYEGKIVEKAAAPAGTPALDGASQTMDLEQVKETAKKYYRENRNEEALRLFEKALELDPNNKETLFYMKKAQLKAKTSGSVPTPNIETSAPPTPAVVQYAGTTALIPPGTKVQTVEPVPEPAPPKAKMPDPKCLSCKGSGKCIWCQGSGKCSTCGGTGLSFGINCTTCKGDGKCSVCKGSGNCSWCML